MQSSRQPSLVRAENFTSKGNNAYAAEKRRADFERKVINPMQQVVWNVESSSLRKPTWKILESTHAVIMNTDVSIIVDRIVKINKELSLMAEYDSKKVRFFRNFDRALYCCFYHLIFAPFIPVYKQRPLSSFEVLKV